MRRILPLLLCLFLTASFNEGQNTPRDYGAMFVYAKGTGTYTQIRWFELGETEEQAFDAPPIKFHAISTNSPRVAFTDYYQDLIYVLDLASPSLISLDIKVLDNPDTIYDDETLRSRSLKWSPDGRQLAFVGIVGNDIDVFNYVVSTGELLNLTSDIPIVDEYLDISSWSPDGQWLALVAAWQEQANNSTRLLRTGVVSRDGSEFVELGANNRSCRLRWNESQTYLVTSTDCAEAIFADSRLLIFGFDSVNLENSKHLPVTIHEQSPDFFVRFSMPMWLTDDTFAVISNLQSKGRIISDPINETVLYNVSTGTLDKREATGDHFELQSEYGEWIISWLKEDSGPRIVGYNVVMNKFATLATAPGLCGVSNVRVDRHSNYVAVLGGCSVDQQLAIYLIDLRTSETISVIEGAVGESLIPIGFVTQP